ncbi:hypothetical protein ABZ642_24640 [Streptomyces sp. NPDC007157]|uniref:hypothetical protein n=1 Tax=Streptomyces sp. NPDC007157 TaxID=3154681 RepID=UPI0033F1F0F2
MADEQDKWLNRATAERLLRGESLEAVDESARDQAERLAGVLGALSGRTAPATAELPGEEGALAAFRKARESAGDAWTSVARQPHGPGRGSDAGLIRIGAGLRPSRVPGWARPARFALAAVLTVGMLGGVAVAAGTGVLPSPFDGHRPAPGASVSAAGTPARPQDSPSTESLLGGETDAPSADATPRAPVRPSPDPSGRPKDRSTGSAGTPGNRWHRALRFCRDIQDGKSLGTDRRRALEGMAGGSRRVDRFCKVLLGAGAAGQSGVSDDGKGDGNGQGDQNTGSGGNGNGQGGDDDGRPGRGGGDDRGHGRGHDHRQDGVAAPAPTAFAPLLPNRPGPSADPTYRAL